MVDIRLALGRADEEAMDGFALLALDLSKTIVVPKFRGFLLQTGLSIELWVALLLQLWVAKSGTL